MSLLSAIGRGFVAGLTRVPQTPAPKHQATPAPSWLQRHAGFRGARFAMKSANAKLSPVELEATDGIRSRPVPQGPFCCATSTSIEATCDDSCPFKGNGCFADAGFTRIQSVKMNREAEESTGLEVAQEEAALIDSQWPRGVPQDGARGGRDLRLHVAGDASGVGAARALAGAAQRWGERDGGAVWTFTHAWRTIPRAAWGPIAVLASVESVAQAREAHRAGYAPALVVEDFPNGDKAWSIGGKLKAIPCPAETRGLTCVECRLCLDQDLHKLKRAIAFKAHGQQVDKVIAALEAAT